MNNANIARILQNMIDEAEGNIGRDAIALAHPRNNAQIADRRADLREAVELVAELNKEEG
jgi:hypothetical protein